ncbi:MAG: hydroxyphenylacetyl-CoA thioesterase PaaI [Lautropia sp.]|nr:hydroxyphenylacetyl-CoA thioesterase PaaI [Lautropia sp.]
MSNGSEIPDEVSQQDGRPLNAADMTPEARACACAQVMLTDDEATQALGMKILDVVPGQAQLQMRVTKMMLNGHGTCHGGFLFSLADSAFAFACNTYNQRTVAQHCSISYLAPAFEHDELTATATELTRSGRSGLYDVLIRNQKDELLAVFRGHARTIKGTLLPETATRIPTRRQP